MKPSTFFYNIGQGFKGVFRNSIMTTASVLVLVACMILVGTFYVVIDTISLNFESINDLNVIEILVDKDYGEEQTEQIAQALEQIREDSKIIEKEIVYVSPEENLKIMRTMYPDWVFDILDNGAVEGSGEHGEDGLNDNPLRGSFKVEFINFSDMDEVRRVKNRIDEITVTDLSGNTVDAIPTADIRDHIDLYDSVMSVKNTLYVVGIWLLAILLLISLFVIMNTIKLGVFARRNEITFMRLCGATKAMIRMPYMVEGVIIGVFSAAVAFGIEFYVFQYLLRDIVSASSGSNGEILLADFSQYAPILGVGFLAIGLFAGIISSGISLKKYLKA